MSEFCVYHTLCLHEVALQHGDVVRDSFQWCHYSSCASTTRS